MFTSAIFSSLWHKTDISAQIILGLGRVILKTGVTLTTFLYNRPQTFIVKQLHSCFITYPILLRTQQQLTRLLVKQIYWNKIQRIHVKYTNRSFYEATVQQSFSPSRVKTRRYSVLTIVFVVLYSWVSTTITLLHVSVLASLPYIVSGLIKRSLSNVYNKQLLNWYAIYSASLCMQAWSLRKREKLTYQITII